MNEEDKGVTAEALKQEKDFSAHIAGFVSYLGDNHERLHEWGWTAW